MNPYAYTREEIPPYKESLGVLMVSGAAAVLVLCIAFAVFVQALTILGY